jgi:WD40 repeat protein
LLLSAAAVRLDDTPQTRAALLATLARTEPLSGVLYAGADAADAVLEMELSPDGSLVALREGDDRFVGSVRVLEARTGNEVMSFADSPARDIEFSPDGSRMAVVADAGLYVFDTTSPAAAPAFVATSRPRDRVAFLGDGSRVVMSGGSKFALAGLGIWDLSTGKRLALAEDPCGECALFGGYGGELTRLRDGRVYAERGFVGGIINKRGTRVRYLDPSWVPPTGGTPTSYALSPDGSRYAVGTEAGELSLWKLHGQRPIAVAHHEGPINRIVWSRDGHALATASADNTAAVWTVPQLTRSHQLRGHERGVTDVVFSPDGQEVLTAGGDGLVYTWDLTGASALAPPVNIPDPDPGYYLSKAEFAAGEDGSAHLSGAFQYEFDHASTVDWRTIVGECDAAALSCQEDGAFQIPQQLSRLSADATGARLLLETTQSTLESGSHDRVTLVVGGSASATTKLEGRDAILSPTGSLVAAAIGREQGFGDDYVCALKVGFLSTETLTPAGAEIEHGPCTTPLAFSPDGNLLAVLGGEGTAVYEVKSGRLVKDLGDPPEQFPQGTRVTAMFSSDGEHLAISSDRLELWQTDSWTRERNPVPVDDFGPQFSPPQFSPSGDQLLLFGEADVEILDLAADRPSVTVLPVDPGIVSGAVFLANDRVLIYQAQMSAAVDGDQGVARVWPLDVDTWLDVACRRAGRELTTIEWQQATTSSSSRRPICS